jgi:hypothetical protein
MSLGPFTLLISRECDTYYKTRSQKLIHRVDALRFPHFVRLLKSGGAEAPVRSELRSRSAAPMTRAKPMNRRKGKLVEPIGIEPMTSCLQSRRSPS